MERVKLKKSVSDKEERALIKKSLKYSVKDGVAATIAGATGDTFISPYAIFLNASNFQIGLLSAIPNLIPTELFTAKAMKKFSRKSMVILGVLLQFLIWPLIAFLGIISFKSRSFSLIAPTLLIILYSFYVGIGLFIGPAWMSWMKDLSGSIKLGKYFGMRNRIFGVVSLIAIIIAGLVLDVFKKMNYVFIGFAILFLTASIGRVFSRYYLKKQYEPRFKMDEKYYFSFWQFAKKAGTNNFGRFAIFIGFVNFAQMIAGPFFTPYMLRELKFDYVTFTIINLVISGVATFITMPLWGKFLDKYGCVNTMKSTSIAVSLIPLLWVVSPSPYWLAAVQVISGTSWAGFNLAAGTFIYQAVTKERMGLCGAYSAIFNGLGVFLGAVTGGLITSLHITFMSIFLFVFIVSTAARLAVMAALLPKIKEIEPAKKPHSLFNVILRPLKGVNNFIFENILIHIYPFSKFKTISHKIQYH